MPTNVPLVPSTLPNTYWAGDLQEIINLVAQYVTGEFNNNVLLGQDGGSAPASDIGVWRNGNVFYTWNSTLARYMPVPLVIGRVYSTVLTLTKILSTATADRSLYTPDRDGTIAVTDNIFGQSETKTIVSSGGSATMDWSEERKSFYIVLTENTSFTISNSSDGQTRDLFIENGSGGTFVFGATPFTATGAIVAWNNNGATVNPVAGPTSPSQRAISHYRIRRINNLVLIHNQTTASAGYLINTSGSGSDTAPPAIVSITRNSAGNVVIEYNELLRGATLTTANFIVKNNGTTKTVSAASASGAKVYLTVTGNSNTSSTSVTVQYTGSEVKDLAGNTAATFGPTAATYISGYPPGSIFGSGGPGGQNEP